MPRTLFCCPVCGQPLMRIGPAMRCTAGHSYDLAKERYVNLLLPGESRSREPGDGKEMVAARRRFLGSGLYAPFRTRLAQLVSSSVGKIPSPAVLDAGCGEGYYTAAVSEAAGAGALVCGVDLSKYAVRAAAKAVPSAQFAVAGVFHLPVRSGSVDLLIDVFSPMAAEEYARVVRPGGSMIYAVPGPEHLFGMKQVLYDRPYRNEEQNLPYAGFSQTGRSRVSADIRLGSRQQIADLFSMTPYFWRTPPQGTERLLKLDSLETCIEFDFLLFQRT